MYSYWLGFMRENKRVTIHQSKQTKCVFMNRHHKVGFFCFSVGYARNPMVTLASGTEMLRAGNISAATCRTTM